MLSSTSLLHGNCIFNRNNTVATQQGMKTYWLCKSYRITMCRARCITHQGRVISATGMHNHQPHMKGPYPNSDFIQSGNSASVSSNGNSISVSMRLPSVIPTSIGSTSTTQNTPPPVQHNNSSSLTSSDQHEEATHHLPNDSQPQSSNQNVQNAHHSPSIGQHHPHLSEHASVPASFAHNNSAVSLQNMMQSVLTQNNLMHLSNMAPMLNSMPSHQMQHFTHLNMHHPNDLHISANQVPDNNQDLNNGPGSPRSSMHHAQLVRHHLPTDAVRMSQHHQHANMPQHSHHSTQSNEKTSAADIDSSATVLSSTVETQSQQSQPTTSESDHNLTNELTNSSSFKLEQM